MTKSGEWHPADFWVPLVLQDGTLFLLGQVATAISIPALAGLIQDRRIRKRFQRAVGLPLRPECRVWRKTLRRHPVPRL